MVDVSLMVRPRCISPRTTDKFHEPFQMLARHPRKTGSGPATSAPGRCTPVYAKMQDHMVVRAKPLVLMIRLVEAIVELFI
jgi:hypothetical protein